MIHAQPTAALEKPVARDVVEGIMRRSGITYRELARTLFLSPGAISRKLNARYPDRFTERELEGMVEFLDLTTEQATLLRECYGYMSNPPRRGLSTLPHQPTRFIGRDALRRDLIDAFVGQHAPHLLTLTGPAGVGKTRLATQAACDLSDVFADDVCFVQLDTLEDPARVPTWVAAELDLREVAGRRPLDTLMDFLQHRRMLLVLDNCEHLITACAQLAGALLEHCPGVTILATTRQPLGISGEVIWPVAPLSVPPPADQAADLACDDAGWDGEYEAVRLFVDRATAAQPGFRLDKRTGPAVAEICRRLEGLPLAIELAAATVPVLAVDDLAERLGDCLGLLTAGSRIAAPRHRTLRAAIDWSYNLLEPAEQTVFRRLAAFAGAFELDAAEAVCAGNDPSGREIKNSGVAQLLLQLVSKSLVVADVEHRCYRLLEPLRQRANALLEQSGELDQVRGRHLVWCMQLADTAEQHLTGSHRAHWINRLEQSYENIQAALRWCEIGADAEAALRITGALWRYWQERGRFTEGRYWLERALARDAAASAPASHQVRANALYGAANLAREQGDFACARHWTEDSLSLWRRVGDRHGIAAALNSLGMVYRDLGDAALAGDLYGEALALRRDLGDERGVAASLNNLALLAADDGDSDRAKVLYEEALTIKRALGDRRGIAASLNNLAMLADAQTDYVRADRLYTESLALFTELEDPWGVGVTLHNLGRLAYHRGDLAGAMERYQASFRRRRILGDRPGMALCLEGLAAAAVAVGQPGWGAELLGAADAVRREIGAPLPATAKTDREATLAAATHALGKDMFSAAHAEGFARHLACAAVRSSWPGTLDFGPELVVPHEPDLTSHKVKRA